MRNKKSNNLIALSAFFLLLGAIGWFLPFGGWPSDPHTQAPNSEPHGIALDSKGNIYCGSKFYGRVQKYYPNGRFSLGFDTKGGTGRGSDFGFHINEKDQLCITVSSISKDNKGAVHHLRVYDEQGTLINSERSESDKRNYTHRMNNIISDSSGNLYTFKGFLFPRVIKETPSKQKHNIVTTPVWLWFIKAPFPDLAFFFI